MMTEQYDIETKERIKIHEGCVLKIYDDPLLGSSAPTIFYGHLCTSSDPWEPGITYTQVQAEAVFEEDYAIAKEDAKKFIGNVDVPDEVASVVVEVAFNIGASRLAGFKLFRAAIQNQDFVEASYQLEDSKLYLQLESRYKPLVELIREA
jgi:GH24 family phage-related lysozyme (muramidase)